MTIDKIKALFQQSKGIDFQIQKDISNTEQEIIQIKHKQELLEQAQAFLQDIAQKTQSKLKLQIEDIVNMTLDTCFPGEFIFQIQFNISRGKTEAELVFLSQKTNRPVDPMNASGGGVVDVVAFGLRIASYVLERNINNVIILDEPFRFLSRDLQENAGEVLKKLSEKLGIQIIMITHIEQMESIADKTFYVKKNQEGISMVK